MEVQKINAGLSSFAQLFDSLSKQQQQQSHRLNQSHNHLISEKQKWQILSGIVKLNLHSNKISSIETEYLVPFSAGLRWLDLSSNELVSMEHLSLLTRLQYLNLSNNLITRISGLGGMRSLQELNLSYNKLQSLEGLSALHGTSFSLEILDLHSNKIAEYAQFFHLIGLSRLKHLRISDNMDMVEDKRAYFFGSISSLISLDLLDRFGNEIAIPDFDLDCREIISEAAMPNGNGEVSSSVVSTARLESLENQLSQIVAAKIEDEEQSKAVLSESVAMRDSAELDFLRKELSRVSEERSSLLSELDKTKEELKVHTKDIRDAEIQLLEMKHLLEKELAGSNALSKELGYRQNTIDKITMQYEELQESYHSLQMQMSATKSEIKCRDEAIVELKSKLSESTGLQDRVNSLENEKLRIHDELQRTLLLIETHAKQAAEDKSQLSLQIIKDRELYRNNLERVKEELRKSERTNDELRSHLNTVSSKSNSDIFTIKEKLRKQLERSFEEKLERCRVEMAVKNEKLESDLRQSQQSIKKLELDKLESCKDYEEKIRCKDDEIRSLKLKTEILDSKCCDLKEANSHILLNSKRLADVLRDLKSEILIKNELLLVAKEENKRRDAINRTDQSSNNEQISKLEKQLEELRCQLLDKDDEIKKLKEQHSSSILPAPQDDQIKKLQSLQEETNYLQQAIRVKDKMLDDQNSLIRTLKQSISEKTSENMIAIEKESMKSKTLDSIVEKQKQSIEKLEVQLKQAEKRETKLKKSTNKYAEECERLQSQVEELEECLSQRDEMIKSIEHEVANVKKRLSTQVQESKSIPLELQKQIEELTEEKETFCRKYAILESQNVELQAKLHPLRQECDSLKQSENELKSKIEQLKTEHEAYRSNAEERLSKVRLMLQEI